MGKIFHPQVFYTTIQDIYEQYCVTAEPPPIASMEVIAFITLLAGHLHTFNDGSFAFRLGNSMGNADPPGSQVWISTGYGYRYRMLASIPLPVPLARYFLIWQLLTHSLNSTNALALPSSCA